MRSPHGGGRHVGITGHPDRVFDFMSVVGVAALPRGEVVVVRQDRPEGVICFPLFPAFPVDTVRGLHV